MTRAAAFFDLDKTILATSSALAFARPFYRGGLIGRSDVIRSAYAQFLFLASGADHDQMETMRRYTESPRTDMDLADASLLWLAADTGVNRIMTLDVHDFSRYRLPDGRAFEIL